MSATPTMKLVKVDFAQIERATGNLRQTEFNTSFHSAEEAPDLETPSEAPASFKRWLPLILRTRQLPPSALQTVTLSRAQICLLLKVLQSTIFTGVLSRVYAEDVEDEIAPSFSNVIFPPEGLFIRLDGCSPKDGRQKVPGKIAVRSVAELILRLTTSLRARNDFTRDLEEGKKEIEIFLLPFNERMMGDREYRVFCAPGGGNITGISQYRWHRPWIFSQRSPRDMERIASTICGGIRSIHRQILADLYNADAVDRLLLAQGFSFDVFFDEGEELQLVELNGFGVRSSCGSALFQWVNDRELLYGSASGVTEFRVAIASKDFAEEGGTAMEVRGC